MSGSSLYNDTDPFICAWVRELIRDGLVPDGEVDERSIADVQPSDLRGFVQCHFFCGILGWPYALELAGWDRSREVWTGSVPCQPFSAAGKRKGTADKRHLWPAFRRLIEQCRPETIFGEQVASAEVIGTRAEADFAKAVHDGDYAKANKLAKRLAQTRGFHELPRWVDGVQADLAALGYAFRFKVLGAHSVGAPHIRQRLFWVANAECAGVRDSRRGTDGAEARRVQGADGERKRLRVDAGTGGNSEPGGLADAERAEQGTGDEGQQGHAGFGRGGLADDGTDGGLGDATGGGRRERGDAAQPGSGGHTEQPGGAGCGFWSDSHLIACRDGKLRRVPAQSVLLGVSDGLPGGVGDGGPESGFPLAERFQGRVGLLRGVGNAIIPQVAAAFIQAMTGATP